MKGEIVDFDERPVPKKPKNKGGRPRKKQIEVPTSPFADQGNQSFQAKIERVLEGKRSPVDLEELAMEFHQALGGSRGFAQRIMAAYDAATKGSPEEARLLDAILKLFEKAGRNNMLTDLDTISDDDLENLIQAKMRDIGGFSREEIMQAVGRRVEILEYPDHVCI